MIAGTEALVMLRPESIIRLMSGIAITIIMIAATGAIVGVTGGTVTVVATVATPGSSTASSSASIDPGKNQPIMKAFGHSRRLFVFDMHRPSDVRVWVAKANS
jgi:hypothetical protein